MHWLNSITTKVTDYIHSLPPRDVRMAEIVAGGILVLFIAWWCWWHLPKRQVARLPGLTDPKDQGDLENNFRQTITQTVGGLVVLFGAVFAYVQFREQRNDFQVQQNQFQLQQQAAHDLLISNQVSKGFEDLGSTSIMIRIGGIYALEGVMNTSPPYYKAVFEGLCAFIRENAAAKISTKTAVDVQAALTVISRRKDGIGTVDLRGAQLPNATIAGDFTNALLDHTNWQHAYMFKANLTNADLSNSNLSYTNLVHTSLSYATLSGSNLDGANLADSDLSNADLHHVNLNGSDLSDANLENADLSYSLLSEAILQKADLSQADLSSANLESANLHLANLANADLSSSNLAGADLTRVNLTNADLDGANVTGAAMVKTVVQPDQLKQACGQNVIFDTASIIEFSAIKPCLQAGDDAP